MIWLRSVRLVASVLAVVCCATAAPMVLDAWPESPAASHHHHGQHPDSGPDGAPCGSACPCVCCHGQAQVSLPCDVGVGLGVLPVHRHAVAPAGEFQPDDLVQSIFHPPRRLTPA
jgi:hypothetical protein